MAPASLPWRKGRAGSVVTDRPYKGGFTGSDDVAYYGGHLICESVSDEHAEFIVRACNAHADLLAALSECLSELERATNKHDHNAYREMALSAAHAAIRAATEVTRPPSPADRFDDPKYPRGIDAGPEVV